MNEVQVYFLGIVLWWLAAPGPFVLVPDLATNEVEHYAFIHAPASAFVDGNCPDGFTTDSLGDCEFALNGAGATGGVTISFVAAASRPMATSSFCTLPRLQRTTTYVLRHDSTPPLGAKNAAWMVAEGGNAVSGMMSCENAVPGNCPRFVRWSVPATETQPVKLVLGNLKDGAAPIEANIKAGAQIRISNSPPAGHHAEHRPTRIGSPEDWCAYFDMIERPNGVRPSCPGVPRIPLPCSPTASQPRMDGVVLRRTFYFQTVACSNSQYP